jgi:pyruvate/2-oxoglutarate dehydrogenase complex dihydrolipoamide dehydrogenase (E3) component
VAHFLSPNEITVNRRHLSAKNFLVATGAHWAVPDIQGLDKINYLTPRTILESIRPPKSLFIIGGGGIGVEIAQLMAIFGTKVYIGEIASRLLPHQDAEVGTLFERTLLEQKGITVLTHTRVLAVAKDGINKRVMITRAGVEKTIRVDEILIAAGRTPTVDLGLENATVKYTPKGI